jgi:hypothetical protein
MQYITGRIVYIGKPEIISKNGYSFPVIVFAIKKRMDGAKRYISFECVGKLAEKISKLQKDEKIEVKYLINSSLRNEKWYTTLNAKEVEVLNGIDKKYTQQLIL